MLASARRTSILAGGGSLPREIADSARARGGIVHIVAIDGEADADFGAHDVTHVNWGQIGKMIRTLKASATDDLVIVGRVHRPELGGIRTDFGFFRNLPAIVKIVASGGDDSVLRRVVRFFEQHGLNVIGPGEAAPELVIGTGPLGDVAPGSDDAADVARGFAVVRALGAYDIGQGVIVTGGEIEAIEGAEGTDRMLARAEASRGQHRAARRGVFIKRSKPGQDLRVDMPAIGPATVDRVAAAGLRGIAVEAGKVLMAGRAKAVPLADAAHVFVVGVSDDGGVVPDGRYKAKKDLTVLKSLGATDAPERHRLDALKGAAVIRSLAPFNAGRAVVVVRNHVLAVEAGEGVAATLARAADLRQWASVTRRRRGMLVLSHPGDLSAELVRSIERAGYAGVAVLRPLEATVADTFGHVIGLADGAGLVVLAVGSAGEDQL